MGGTGGGGRVAQTGHGLMEAAMAAMIAGTALTMAVSAGGRMDGGKAAYALAEADGIRDRAIEAISRGRGAMPTVGMVADGTRLMDSSGHMGDDRIVAAQGVFGAVTINPVAMDGSRGSAFRIVLREIPAAACSRIAMGAADRYDDVSINGKSYGARGLFDSRGALGACSGTSEIWLEVGKGAIAPDAPASTGAAQAAVPASDPSPGFADTSGREPRAWTASTEAIAAPAPYDDETIKALAARPDLLEAAIGMERDRLAKVYRARLAILSTTPGADEGRLLDAAARLGISADDLSR